MNIIRTLFDWPNGIVVGNLIASGICIVLAAIHLDRLARKHHRVHMTHLRKAFPMPYEVQGPNANGKYEVINSETKEVKSEKDAKEDADRQARILNRVEKDPGWETENA